MKPPFGPSASTTAPSRCVCWLSSLPRSPLPVLAVCVPRVRGRRVGVSACRRVGVSACVLVCWFGGKSPLSPYPSFFRKSNYTQRAITTHKLYFHMI